MPLLKRTDDVSWKSNGSNFIILNLKSGNYYSSNETCIAFLKYCDGKRGFKQIVGLLSKKYRTPSDVISTDLAKLAKKLLKEKLLRRYR
jgi:hypothetical protein